MNAIATDARIYFKTLEIPQPIKGYIDEFHPPPVEEFQSNLNRKCYEENALRGPIARC